MQFSGGSINNYMRYPIQLSTPLNSQLTFRIYAATKGPGGGAKTDFAPWRGKP